MAFTPLYSRADYERDLAAIDGMSAEISRAIAAERMEPMHVMKWNRFLDELRRKCWNQLQRTRMILSQRKPGKAPVGEQGPQFFEITSEQAFAIEQTRMGIVKRDFDQSTNTTKCYARLERSNL